MRYSDPFLLSESGSTRATAYNWGNKCVTLEGRTHVVWLDAVSQVCGRTYDHATKSWGSTHRLHEGCDNHANPSLTADRHGHLRMTWGPHGWGTGWNQGRIKWAISDRPHDLSAFSRQASFGYNATAAAIVHTPNDLDAVVSRGGEVPCGMMFHQQRPKGGFSSAHLLMHQDIAPQYTHHYGHITCDARGTLYAATHFYNVGGGDNHPVQGDKSRMRSYGMAILRSTDAGHTWSDLRGHAVQTPTLYEERLAIPPLNADMYVCGIEVDPSGTLWALANQRNMMGGGLLLSQWRGEAGWQTVDLSPNLPPDRVSVDACLGIDRLGRIHVAVTGVRPEALAPSQSQWGHPSCEVFHLCSQDGGRTFACQQISRSNDQYANWLPTLSKSGPFHPVDKPALLYTCGVPGQGCTPSTKTQVWCVFIED